MQVPCPVVLFEVCVIEEEGEIYVIDLMSCEPGNGGLIKIELTFFLSI